MNSHTKHLLTALLVVGLVALAGSPVAAQPEMTSKIRLECATATTECPGAAAQYDFSVTSTDFGIRKVGASSDALHVNGSNGRVGVNTNNALAPFHIFGAESADVFNAVGPDPTAAGTALNFGYAGASFGKGAGFFNVRPSSGTTAPNPSIRFATANVVRMTIDNQGFVGIGIDEAVGAGNFDPLHPLHHKASGAHLTAGGTWTNASSRDLKEGIVSLTADEAMSTLYRLDPVKFKYTAEPGEQYVGFIAEDVPELVGSTDHKTLSPMDVVAVLTRVLQEHEQTITELRQEIETLKAHQQ